jgi:5-methylthioadenosine/S-adenosylhomocysteine deaminase
LAATLIETRAVLTLDPARPFVPGGRILVEEGRIRAVLSPGERAEAAASDFRQCVALPGFIQTHLHLCQTLFRGLADDLELLAWLRSRIFPLESAHDSDSMRASARMGLFELTRSGTTTLMDMGSVRHTEVLGEEIEASGLRAYFGKALMDINPTCPSLCEPTRAALDGARELARHFHGRGNGRLRFAYTPRFVLSCTDELMRESHALATGLELSRWHTHASESPLELSEVRARCGCANVEHLDRVGTLSPLSCLAHCVQLVPEEVEILKRTGAHVLHCPSSNLKLGSGLCDVPGLLAQGISVSLGCDGAACNNALDMFTEMRLAALLQKPLYGPTAMPALEVLELATLGGARALGLEAEVGSLAPGKAADLILLDLDRAWNSAAQETLEDFAGAIVYSGRPENVHAVMASGEWLVRDGRPLRFDEAETVRRARETVGQVRRRAGV